jgi:hypothetical protein
MTQTTTPPALDDEKAARVMDAMAPMLGLTIDPAWRGGVIANLKVTSTLAALVLEFPLTDEDEPAAVFRP